MKMEVLIVILFYVAASIFQNSFGQETPTTGNVESKPNASPGHPQPILPVVADNVYYYGGRFGNYVKSLLAGDEWSVKYVLHKLLEGSEYVVTTVAQTLGSVRNSALLSINPEPAKPATGTNL